MNRIFINYRRQDTEAYVDRLYEHLTQHFKPETIFMDVDSIKPGADFVQTLEDAVAGCDVFIAMIGPQWLDAKHDDGSRRLDQWDDFVRIEIASALKQNKLVIPVLVGQARMPSPADLPDDLKLLARRNATVLTRQGFVHDVKKLVDTIKEAVPSQPSFKPQVASETIIHKEAALKAVRDDLNNATTSPLYQFRIVNRLFPVFGEGNADANILFIGESPGKNETETGKPFCGPSGEVLDEMLRSINLKREDVFITNILLDRPADQQREPTPEELAFYTPFMDRIVDIIQPAVIATLGRFAMEYMLKKLDLPEKGGTITQLHGKLIKAKIHYGEIYVIPMFHPAVAFHRPSHKEMMRKDFEKLKLFI